MNTPYGTPPPPPSASSPVNGTLILILGIVSLFCAGVITGPIAWIMANNALKTLDQYGDPLAQRGTVNAGRICGIVGTILAVLGTIGYIAVIVLGVARGHATHSYTP